MANEISISVGLNVTKGSLRFNFPQKTLKVSMAGTHQASNVQDVPTTSAGTAVAIPTGIATAGYCLFVNLDATNYVEIGEQVSSTFYPLLRLYPGEVQVVRMASLTFYARANTAAVALMYAMIEN